MTAILGVFIVCGFISFWIVLALIISRVIRSRKAYRQIEAMQGQAYCRYCGQKTEVNYSNGAIRFIDHSSGEIRVPCPGSYRPMAPADWI